MKREPYKPVVEKPVPKLGMRINVKEEHRDTLKGNMINN
jgi:hypothetical protein